MIIKISFEIYYVGLSIQEYYNKTFLNKTKPVRNPIN